MNIILNYNLKYIIEYIIEDSNNFNINLYYFTIYNNSFIKIIIYINILQILY